jgi:hypothetical protein
MATGKWTYEDLLRLPYDGLRHEVIDGVHYATEAHYTKEQRVLAQLKALIHYPFRDTFFYDRGWELSTMGVPGFVIHVLPEWTTTFEPAIGADVAEYWVIHPAINAVGIFRRNGAQFQRVPTGDTLTTPFLPGFALSLQKLFA